MGEKSYFEAYLLALIGFFGELNLLINVFVFLKPVAGELSLN